MRLWLAFSLLAKKLVLKTSYLLAINFCNIEICLLATGFHYGVQTCESCKGFFKRTVQNKKEFKCARNNDCEIHISNRKKCPACRFNKCCEVGMRVEGLYFFVSYLESCYSS